MTIVWLHLFQSLLAALWSPEFYLDPGSGSYLLQLLIASIMGALLMLRVYWSKVKGFFSRLFGRSASEDEE